MKKPALLAAILVLAGAIVVLLTSAGSAQQSQTHRIVLVQRGGEVRTIDNRPRSPRRGRISSGDQLAFTELVYDRDGRRIGSLHGFCVETVGGRRARGPCTAIFGLTDGTIVVTGMATPRRNNFIFAVVGGTGLYDGMRGSGFTKNRPGSSEVADTVISIRR
jgi:hypothetical protein